MIVIASIHQPSTSTFGLFDKVLLLSGGKSQYFGPVKAMEQYFDGAGYPIPQHTNPAEFVLEMLNVDFDRDHQQAQSRLTSLQQQWAHGERCQGLTKEIDSSLVSEKPVAAERVSHHSRSMLSDVLTLVHRSFIKSYRDVIAYGIRIAMYLGKFSFELY